jgi:hypothetical protein
MDKTLSEKLIPVDSIPERAPPPLTWEQQKDGSWVGSQDGSLGKEASVRVEPMAGGWWVSEMLDDGYWAAPPHNVDVFDTAEAAMQAADAGCW